MKRKAAASPPNPAPDDGPFAATPPPEPEPRPEHGPAAGFEEQLAELEALVDRLESGDLTLEQSLAAFERGVRLTRACQKALDAAEQRVRILMSSAEGAEPEPFADG